MDAGADDCMVSPFSAKELLARVRAILRRVGQTENPETFESGEIKIDFERRIVSVRGARVHLTPKEFELLGFLVANKGKPLRIAASSKPFGDRIVAKKSNTCASL